jgi:hypothetical protein
MGSLVEELERREAAARAEVDRLRSRIEELSEELARAEEQVTRPAGDLRPASPVGAVTVPPWREGSQASVLPQSYQDLLEVAADAGRPLRAGEFAAAAGLGTDKAKVESLRSKLKLLAARGWLAGETPPPRTGARPGRSRCWPATAAASRGRSPPKPTRPAWQAAAGPEPTPASAQTVPLAAGRRLPRRQPGEPR